MAYDRSANVDFSRFPAGEELMALSADQRRTILFGEPRVDRTDQKTTTVGDEYSSDMRGDAFVRQYEGTNARIRSVIVDSITNDNCYMFKVILPIRPLPEGKVIKVTVLHFNNHSLDNVPETGTVRVTTNKFIEWKSGIERKGLGFQMEDGFAMTPIGVLTYLMSIEQISNATKEAMVLEGFSHILNSQPSAHEHLAFYNPTALTNLQTPERVVQYMLSIFGVLTKTALGLNRLIHMASDIFQRRGIVADTIILPNGTRHVLAMQTTQQTFAVTGITQQQLYAGVEHYVTTINGYDIFESPLITLGDTDKNSNNAKEDVLVGNMHQGDKYTLPFPFVMRQALINPPEWRSSMQSTEIYSCDDDRWMPMYMKDLLPKMGIWDAQGTNLAPIGEALFQSGGTSIGMYITSCSKDNQLIRDYARFIVKSRGSAEELTKFINDCNSKGKAENANSDTDLLGAVSDAKRPGRVAHDAGATIGPTGLRRREYIPGRQIRMSDPSDNDDDDDDDLFAAQSNRQRSQFVPTDTLTLWDASDVKELDPAAIAALAKATGDPIAQLVVSMDSRNPPTRIQLLEILRAINDKTVSVLAADALRRCFKSTEAQLLVYQRFAGDNSNSTAPYDILAFIFRGKPRFTRHPTTGSVHLTRLNEGVLDQKGGNRYPHLNARIPGYYLSMRAEIIKRSAGGKKQPQVPDAAASDNLIAFDRFCSAIDTFLADPATIAHAAETRDALNRIIARIASAGTIETAHAIYLVAVKHTKAFTQEGGKDEIATLDTAVATQYKAMNSETQTSAVGETNADTLKVIKALFNLPLTLGAFQFLIHENIPVPLGIRFARPYVEWRTGKVIVMKKGIETGQTVFGAADMQLGNDTHRKVLNGNFTCEMGALITRPANILIMHDALVKEYGRRGGGVVCFDLNDPESTQAHEGTSTGDNDSVNTGKYSILLAPLMAHEEDARNITDSTGFLPGEDQNKPDFAVAKAFRDAWHLAHRSQYFSTGSSFMQPQANTLLVQGPQWYPIFSGGKLEQRGHLKHYDGWWSATETFDGCIPNRTGMKGGLQGVAIPVSLSHRS